MQTVAVDTRRPFAEILSHTATAACRRDISLQGNERISNYAFPIPLALKEGELYSIILFMLEMTNHISQH